MDMLAAMLAVDSVRVLTGLKAHRRRASRRRRWRSRVPGHGWVCVLDSAERGEPIGVVAATKRLSEHHRRRLPAAVHGGQTSNSSWRCLLDAIKICRDAQGQPESDELINWVDGDRRRLQDQELRWSLAKGNDEIQAMEASPSRFILLEGPRRRDGSLEHHGGAWDGLKRRRGDMAGVRVLVMVHRRGTGSGRSGNGKPRVCPGSGGLFVDDGERWRGSWCGRVTRRLHRAASQIGRLKTMSSSVGPTCRSVPNRYAAQAPGGLASWAGWVGLRPGKCFLYFFSASYSFSIFCFAVLNSN
jgi:hypothetical protein